MTMNERTRKLYDDLKNCYVWEKLEEAYKDQGQVLTEDNVDLYVHVIDTQGPADLAGISKQYSILEEIVHNNFSNYSEIHDNLEAFLKKLLFIIDSGKYEEYKRTENRGIAKILKWLGIIDDDYFDKTKQKPPLYRICSNIIYERNSNSHSAPITSPDRIAEVIWKSLFIELWAVRKYHKEIGEKRDQFSEDEYQRIVELYLQYQISAYEKIQEKGFTYIQTEYENTKDPERDDVNNDNDYDDISLDIIKGTADSLLDCVQFEKTPSVKLIAEAGMGKTVMLEYLNYKLSRDLKEEQKNVLPLLIYCNDTKGDLKNYLFKDTVINKLRLFLDSSGWSYFSEIGLLEYMLRKYKVLFLLDGLNEIKKSSMDKSKFIKSLENFIRSDNNKRCYFLITERYSRGATTIKNKVVYYKLSDISEDIKRQFFSAKGADVLFCRLEAIKQNYDAETQKELNALLSRPFYLSVFCEMADSFSKLEDSKLPKNKQELMDVFIKRLIKRENEKGELAANYMYVRLYLAKLAELSSLDNRILLTDVLKGFTEVTQEYGLNNQEYSSNHMIELFEQLGLIRCSDDMYLSIEEIYAEYMDELLLQLL